MAQNNTTIPDKTPGGTLTSAEFNELDDAVNNNATDAENRFTDLETAQDPQSLSSLSGVLTVDQDFGSNVNVTLTEDVTGFSITNTVSGDSGLIRVKQDNTAGWTFASTYDVLVGDLADIASITPSGSGAASIGWYNDGTDNYLYVSSAT